MKCLSQRRQFIYALFLLVVLLAGCTPDRFEALNQDQLKGVHRIALVAFLVEPDVKVVGSEKKQDLPQLAATAADYYVVYLHNTLKDDKRLDFVPYPVIGANPDFAMLVQQTRQTVFMGGPVTSRPDLPYISPADKATLMRLPSTLGVDAVLWVQAEYLFAVEDRLGQTNRWRGIVVTEAKLFGSNGELWEAHFRTVSETTAQGTPMGGLEGFLGGETLSGDKGLPLLQEASEQAADRLIEELVQALAGNTPAIIGPHWLAPFRPYITLLVLALAIFVGMVALREKRLNWLLSISIVLIVCWLWLQFFAGWGFTLRDLVTSALTPTVGMTWWVRTFIVLGLPILPGLLYSYVDEKLEYSVSTRLRAILTFIFLGLMLAGVIVSFYLLIFHGWWRFVLRTILTGD